MPKSKKSSMWLCECGQRNVMPDGDVTSVKCSQCSREHTLAILTQNAPAGGQPTSPIKPVDQWPPGVAEAHAKAAAALFLPKWATDLTCPFCSTKFGANGIRAIGLHTHAQHFGNIVVDAHCRNCDAFCEYHYRKACRTVSGFEYVLLLDRVYEETSEGVNMSAPIKPILLGDIPPSHNNITESMGLIVDETGESTENKE